MDAPPSETHGEKATWELLKNAIFNFQYILEVAPHGHFPSYVTLIIRFDFNHLLADSSDGFKFYQHREIDHKIPVSSIFKKK